jgi:transcriptional regulator GlxA family with amidase domain
MLLYPGFTMLDLVGPLQVFSMHARLHLLWKDLEPVASDSGVSIVPTTRLADCPSALDVLFVPGGFGIESAMRDSELMAFVQSAGAHSDYITSVCGGSIMLAAAGLMTGYKATTHWAVHGILGELGAVPVKARVVIDRNRMSGGGVTAGIDFGLTVLAALRGEDVAKAVQLMMEYDPAPPFDAGSPEKAGDDVVAAPRAMTEQFALNGPPARSTSDARASRSIMR